MLLPICVTIPDTEHVRLIWLNFCVHERVFTVLLGMEPYFTDRYNRLKPVIVIAV